MTIKLSQGAANMLRSAREHAPFGGLYLSTDHPDAAKRFRFADELERKGLSFPRINRGGRVVLTAEGDKWS
jgi:hypothetical protein